MCNEQNINILSKDWIGVIGSFLLQLAPMDSGEGNGHPLQYSCLENPMDKGAWWGSNESDTTERLTHTPMCSVQPFCFYIQIHVKM